MKQKRQTSELQKTTSRHAQYKRWRKERGIKLLMVVSPIRRGTHLASVMFEGKLYSARGKTNTEAVQRCFSILLDKANLN